MNISKSFETATGRKVEVKGQLLASGKYEIEIIVKGVGNQGGTPSLTKFSKNGIDYVAIVGKLPLTQSQLDIINAARAELMEAKNALLTDQTQYGVYEEVEINNPWMRKTY